MKRIVRILGLVMVLTAFLVVSIAGTAFAANGNGPNGVCDGSGPVTDCSGPWGPYGSYGEGTGNSYGEPAQNCILD